MKFQVLRFLGLVLYTLLGHFMTLTFAKIIQCWCQMNKWVWSIRRIILTGKNQNTQRKTWPRATLSTTNPKRTCLQVNPGIGDERSVTNSQSHLPTVGKWPKNAFYCIYQSRCVVLHVACVTNTGCVLFERLCNRNCHKALLSEVHYVCQISHI